MLSAGSIINYSITVFIAYVAVWIFLLQKDFKTRFEETLEKFNQFKQEKIKKLQERLENKKEIDTIVHSIELINDKKGELEKKIENISNLNRAVVIGWGITILFALWTSYNPNAIFLNTQKTMILVLHYIFGVYILLFIWWAYTIFYQLFNTFTKLEKTSLDQLLREWETRAHTE